MRPAPPPLPLTTAEPPLTGDTRFDALLAASAEYIATSCARPGPLWTLAIDRFLTTPWWVSSLPSARTEAMVWTSAPFRRRGVYLDRHDLNHDGVQAPVPEPLFNAEGIHAGFTPLAEKLQRQNIVGQVHVFGGAAMLLAYDPARTDSRDITALFTPVGPMVTAIHEVANENHWPTTWLDDQAAIYVFRTPGEGQRVFDHPNFQVMATPPEQLMAMKILAAQATRDADDLRTLFAHLHINQPTDVWPIVNRFFPETAIPPRAQTLLEVLLAEQPDRETRTPLNLADRLPYDTKCVVPTSR